MLTALQTHPQAGVYFVGLFCRYGALTYVLCHPMGAGRVQTEYLMAQVWWGIFEQLPDLQLGSLTLRNWVVDFTATSGPRVCLPPPDSIRYTIQKASPPLWCYLRRAFDTLPPLVQLVLTMAHIAGWGEERICRWLGEEGEDLGPGGLPPLLQYGHTLIKTKIPPDLAQVYGLSQEATSLA